MSRSPGDRLNDPDVWRVLPDDVLAGLRQWATAQPFRIDHRRSLTDGRSGAFVAVVRLSPDNGRIRQVIVKLLPPSIAAAETRGVELARQYTPPGFWRQHMVDTTERSALPGTGWWLHVQEIAQADLAELRPLATLLDAPGLDETCGLIVDRVVTDWQAAHDPSPETGTVADHLTRFLADHRDRLTTFATAQQIPLDPPADELRLPGRPGPLPNPFALLAGTVGTARSQVEVFTGNGHGDLHVGNVMVPVTERPPPKAFRLIDLGRFSPTAPVARDPVKLTLSLAAAWLPALAVATPLRSALAELVVAPDRDHAAPSVAGYLPVLRRIRDAAAGWARQRSISRGEWERQYLLLLIGSALRTVADEGLPTADRWWFLEVAALATRAFADPAGHPATLTPSGGAPPPATVAPAGAGPVPVGAPTPAAGPLPVVPAPEPAQRGTISGETTSTPPAQGRVKVAFSRRLGEDWRDLADLLDVPPYDRARFTPGHEGRALWEWLEVRDRLPWLQPALVSLGRDDLVTLLLRGA